MFSSTGIVFAAITLLRIAIKASAEAEKLPGLTGYGRLKDLAAAGPLMAVTNLSLAA